MLGVNLVAADTDEQARFLLTSVQQAFVSPSDARTPRAARRPASFAPSMLARSIDVRT